MSSIEETTQIVDDLILNGTLSKTSGDQTINGIFSMKSIMTNMLNHDYGIDVDFIKYMIEEAAKKSQRIQYILKLIHFHLY